MNHLKLAPLVLSVTLLGACAGHKEKEVTVEMSALPAAVRATLEKESQGGKVTEIEKEVKKGKTIYSADVTVNGAEWDVAIAEDGTLISKEKEKAGEK